MPVVDLGAVDRPLLTVLALVLVAFAAGWVDAVVGGGGLIQLPALLIGLPSSAPPASVLGTNKLSSVFGTAASSLTYAVRMRPDWRTVLPLVVAAAAGSAGGAELAKLLPKDAFTPIVLVALVGVGLYTWRRPQLGLTSARKHAGSAHYGRTAVIGLGVGAYDGFLGPGTGSFFVILLVSVLGYGFLEASAKAKIANLATNLSAITVFALHGSVLWTLGLMMGAANLLGGLLGARTALRHGNAFVRRVFLLVLAGLILKLGYDTVRQLS
ncbi:sulfite exporter TauE/SafE family protein [uncultured Friedmanniella sp.]|uniref:sulfite exporter TauE/SafE family protein n=1 Tax=uncultured Friedmanniella sp. TaxID=335381 RepID=UPI0035CCA616